MYWPSFWWGIGVWLAAAGADIVSSPSYIDPCADGQCGSTSR